VGYPFWKPNGWLFLFVGVFMFLFSPRSWRTCISSLFALFLIGAAAQSQADTVNYIETQINGQSGVVGLDGISDIAVSRDGKFVYASSYRASAVSVFERNLLNGQLTYRSTITGAIAAFSVDVSGDGESVYAASPTGGKIFAYSRNAETGALTVVNSVGTVGGTAGFVSVSVSPDSKHVYGVGGQPSGLVVFGRDQETGDLTVLFDYKDNVDGHELGQQFSPTFSPIKNIVTSADGQFVYVTSTVDSAITLFSRNATTGALTQVAVYKNGTNGVDGILTASSAKRSPDGKHLYVTGQSENSVAVFSIDSTTGELTYLDKMTNGAGGIEKLAGARSLAVSPDGRYVMVSAITANALTIFSRNASTGLLTLDSVVNNNANSVIGLSAPSGMSTDPLNRHLYVAGQADSALVVFSLPTPAVSLTTTTATAQVSGAAVTLDNALSIFDSDSTHLLSATVSVTSGFISTDTLAVQTVAGISASYDSAVGILSLSGNATLADYQTVLRSLSYQAGADPSLAAGASSSRNIAFSVTDTDNNTSAPAVITVAVEKPLGFTVTFVDWDSAVLSSQLIASGGAATAPTAPSRTGYAFTGWDLAFDNVTADLTVTAQYRINTYTVTFDLNSGSRTGGGALTQTVNYGLAATAPVFTGPAGTTFTGWSTGFDTVTADLTVTAQYSINSYNVTFNLDGGNRTGGGALTQTVNYGLAATVPIFTPPPGKTFSGWSGSFDNVTASLTITAQYALNSYTVTATVIGDGTLTPATQQVQSGSSATLTLNLVRADDYVSLGSNCSAALSGNQITTTGITGDCAITVTVYAAVAAAKNSDKTLAVNESSRFTVTGGVGDKLLSGALLKRSGDETVLDLADANALVKFQSDGSYLFSASRTGRYTLVYIDSVSGEHVTLGFDVLPYIAFTSSKQPVQQNTLTKVRVWLSDEPIEYPVVADFVATGSTLVAAQFELTAADNLRRTYDVTATAEVANIRLNPEEVTAALVGTPAVHTLAVQQQLPALALTASATQNGQQVSVVTPIDGDVALNVVELNDINATYIWSADGLVLTTNGATANFNPATVPEGLYTVTVQANSLDGRTGQYNLVVRVIADCPLDSCADTGNSGVPVAANPHEATPNRLALCPAVTGAANRVNSCQVAGATSLYAEVPSQYILALGALSGDQSWGSGQFGIAVNDKTLPDPGYNHLGAVVNFDVLGLEHPGEAVPILVPLPAGTTIPQDAVWRKYIDNQWQNFVVNDDNKLHSAAHDASGQCPGVSADTWVDGLVPGLNCVRLTIEDGGPNDADGVANNTIRDPGVLAVALTPEPPVEPPVVPPVEPVVKDVSVKSGGGSMGGASLLLMGLLGLIRFRKTLAAIALLPLPVLAQGVYVGVDGLSVTTSVENADVSAKVTGWNTTGMAEVDDSSRTGWRVYGGLPLTDTLFVELGWLDLGEITTRFNGVHESTTSAQLTSISPQSGKGIELGMRWQVTDRFEHLKPSLRAGVWMMDFKQRYIDDAGIAQNSEGDNVAFIGADAQWVLSNNWSTKLGVSRYYTHEYGTATIHLGVLYSF
jgi:6-phosphogluconolactonase (cycloisomerase 2 family)